MSQTTNQIYIGMVWFCWDGTKIARIGISWRDFSQVYNRYTWRQFVPGSELENHGPTFHGYVKLPAMPKNGDSPIRIEFCRVSILLWAPVVRHDAFYALLFCLAVRVYVYFSPHLSRGSTGWVGVGGGGGGGGSGGGGGGGVGGGLIAFCRLVPVASSFRHAPDVTLYRSSLAILDTLMMLRSIDLLLQSSTRSRCYAL